MVKRMWSLRDGIRSVIFTRVCSLSFFDSSFWLYVDPPGFGYLSMCDMRIPLTQGKHRSISDVLLRYVVKCKYSDKNSVHRAISSLFILSCGLGLRNGMQSWNVTWLRLPYELDKRICYTKDGSTRLAAFGSESMSQSFDFVCSLFVAFLFSFLLYFLATRLKL
jgi:hypothetical protein